LSCVIFERYTFDSYAEVRPDSDGDVISQITGFAINRNTRPVLTTDNVLRLTDGKVLSITGLQPDSYKLTVGYITGWVTVAVRPIKQPRKDTRRKASIVSGPQQQ